MPAPRRARIDRHDAHHRGELRRGVRDRGTDQPHSRATLRPILTLGLLGTFAGSVVAPLAYLINSPNGLLVTVLVKVAEGASALPVAPGVTTAATLPLVGLFYLGCVPAAISTLVFPKERWAW